MTITAKYASTCTRCQRDISPGQKIEWVRGTQPYHTACAEQRGTQAAALPANHVIATASGGVRHATPKTNRRAGECEHCGEWLDPGKGRLEFCVEDSGCPIHHDDSGYHLYCLDSDRCKAARAEHRAAAKKAKDARAAGSEAWQRAIALIATPADSHPTWTPVRTVQAVAPRMIHTGAYETITVGVESACYHAPGYFACDWDYPSVTRVIDLTADQRIELTAALDAAITAGIAKERS